MNKGKGVKRLNIASKWVYLIVFDCYTISRYEERELPLNASGRMGHLRDTIIEGGECKVQRAGAVQDLRYNPWHIVSEPPTIPQTQPKVQPKVPQPRKVLLTFDGPQPMCQTPSNDAPSTTERKKHPPPREDEVFPVPGFELKDDREEAVNVPPPTTTNKRTKLNTKKSLIVPQEGTSTPSPAADLMWSESYQSYFEKRLQSVKGSRDRIMWENSQLQARNQLLL